MIDVSAEPVARVYNLANQRIISEEREAIILQESEPYAQLQDQFERWGNRKDEIQDRRLKWGLMGLKLVGASPYLEHNAQVGGVSRTSQYKMEISKVFSCQKSAAWFEGQETGDYYVKPIHCRKHWCPVCGGKGGEIHQARKHAILKRVDLKKYNLRQFVFTIPEQFYKDFTSRHSLNSLLAAAKRVCERFFGVPVYQNGRVVRYRMEKGMIGYLHVFGDQTRGEFMPHVNIHILEPLEKKLKLDSDVIEQIKESWRKSLRGMGFSTEEVVIHYKFRYRMAHKGHAVKYMTRAWEAADLEAVEDEHIKQLLVIDMKGFQYLRFWGTLANAIYKDEMDLTEIQTDIESAVNEQLKFLYWAPFEETKWQSIEKLSDDFYRMKGPNDGKKKQLEIG